MPEPIFHPISALPLIASLIDEQLESCEEQLQNLDPSDRKAPVLDDALVARIIRLYTEQQEMVSVYEEQLRRWKSGELSDEKRQEITRLEKQLERYQVVLRHILSVAQHHKDFTIEKVLEKDDIEVAVDFLSGKMNKWL